MKNLTGCCRSKGCLAEISTFFINLPADQIGNQIVAAQKRICELLDLDRSALLLTDQDDPGMLLLTHVHQPPGSPPPPDRLNARDFYPWTVPKILSGETIVISKMTELPAEACRDRDSFDLFGTKSAVYVPLSVGKGPVFGVVGFVVTRGERDWPKRVVRQFQLVAQIFANALSRQHAEKSLEERLQFELLLDRYLSTLCQPALRPDRRRDCRCPTPGLRMPRAGFIFALAVDNRRPEVAHYDPHLPRTGRTSAS